MGCLKRRMFSEHRPMPRIFRGSLSKGPVRRMPWRGYHGSSGNRPLGLHQQSKGRGCGPTPLFTNDVTSLRLSQSRLISLSIRMGVTSSAFLERWGKGKET